MEEIWADIPGYEGIYQASRDGQIRRISSGKGARPGRILKLINHPRGYVKVNLSKDGHVKHLLVHRLVAAAFLGQEDVVVNHKDGNKRHNADTNLEWVTQGANVEHYYLMAARRKVRENQAGPIDF